eukprot:Lankesteria_metandrocarpae@DN1294_c0_g1_i1.p1
MAFAGRAGTVNTHLESLAHKWHNSSTMRNYHCAVLADAYVYMYVYVYVRIHMCRQLQPDETAASYGVSVCQYRKSHYSSVVCIRMHTDSVVLNCHYSSVLRAQTRTEADGDKPRACSKQLGIHNGHYDQHVLVETLGPLQDIHTYITVVLH